MSDERRASSNAPATPPLNIYSRSYGVASAYRRRGELERTASIRRLLNEPALSARRTIDVTAIALIVAALILRFAPLLVAGLLVLAVAIVPEIWYLFSMRGLTFTHAPQVNRAGFLDVVEVTQELENRSLL